MNNFMNIKENDQHHLDFRLEQPRFLWPWLHRTFPFKALPFSERIVLEHSQLVTGNNSIEHIWSGFFKIS